MLLLQYQEFKQFTNIFGHRIYLYLSGIIALFVLGILVQFSLKGEEHEKENQNKEVKSD